MQSDDGSFSAEINQKMQIETDTANECSNQVQACHGFGFLCVSSSYGSVSDPTLCPCVSGRLCAADAYKRCVQKHTKTMHAFLVVRDDVRLKSLRILPVNTVPQGAQVESS